MSHVESHPEVAAYLDRLSRAAAELPESRRVELFEQIQSHLHEALEVGADAATVRQELDRLGDPEAIVDEARRDSPGREPMPATDRVDSTRNGAATASLALGIAGLCLFWLVGVGLLLGVLAVVLGAIGMRNANRRPEGGPDGRARTGVVLGVVATLASAAVIAVTMPAGVDTDFEVEPIPDPSFQPVEPSETE